MAWPESLTTDQQKAITDFVISLDSWASQLSQLNILGSAIAAAWAGGISSLVSSLQSGDVIPNLSGLGGSQDLSQSDISNLANWATALCNPSNSDQGTGSFASSLIQAICVKAAGINAAIGRG